MPAGSNVRATGQFADFQCDGRLGECRIKTGMGRVELDQVDTLSVKSGLGDIGVGRVAAHADVATGSGDVRLRDLADSGVVKNSNGDTWVGAAAGELRLNAANGEVSRSTGAEAERGRQVLQRRRPASARPRVARWCSRPGSATWRSVSATAPPPGLTCARAAGRVENALEAADAPEPSDDTVEVRARTSAGNIVIRRSP